MKKITDEAHQYLEKVTSDFRSNILEKATFLKTDGSAIDKLDIEYAIEDIIRSLSKEFDNKRRSVL